MSRERLSDPEIQTPEQRFFGQSVEIVAAQLGEQVVIKQGEQTNLVPGQAKTLIINGKSYTISLVEPYSTEKANPAWKNKIPIIQTMSSGTVFCYKHRRGVLTYIKAGEKADNVLLRELEEIASGKKTKTPSEVTRLLGLEHGKQGRLHFSPDLSELRFERSTSPSNSQ